MQRPSGAPLIYEPTVGLWLHTLQIAWHQIVLHGGRAGWAARELWRVHDTVSFSRCVPRMWRAKSGEMTWQWESNWAAGERLSSERATEQRESD